MVIFISLVFLPFLFSPPLFPPYILFLEIIVKAKDSVIRYL